MSYNSFRGGAPYGPPPSFPAFPGSAPAPGYAPPPGLGPPPGMSSAPGMAPPPGVQQPAPATQANRPSGLPANFQPPPNLSNINFNAPVIRLGALNNQPPRPGVAAGPGGRKESDSPATTGRPGLGAERGLEQSRAQVRESMQTLVPPSNEEKLRTIFIHKIPEGVGGEQGVETLLRTLGDLRRWDAAKSQETEHKGELFGFAQFEDAESLAVAVELLRDLEVPVKKQQSPEKAPETPQDDSFDGIEKVQLQVAVDPNTLKYLESLAEQEREEETMKPRLEAARTALKQAVRDLFYPPVQPGRDVDGDTAMGESAGAGGDSVEVINISLQQEDELADIPPAMREVVAAEIAAFRDRSNRRDLERLKREEEMEELERQRNGMSRVSRLDSPPAGGGNSIPLGPRGAVPNAPSGPRGQGRGVEFVNGGATNGYLGTHPDDEDSDASDEELHRREVAKAKSEEDKLYNEAERKWVNRERQKAAALDREKERDRNEAEAFDRRKAEQTELERSWNDEREVSRKAHLYYREHGAWVRKRAAEREEEKARDEADRMAEAEERRREEVDMERARGLADSFLEQQSQEMERLAAAQAEPRRLRINFGEAAQKTQAQRGGARSRTVAEVEGLLDDEEQGETAKRQLIPIKFDPITDTKAMSEEDISKAIRALAQEIPTEKDGLWAWDVKWDYLEESTIREKLRPFVEKKVVEYLGVQEEILVEVVETHLRKHGKPGELLDELAETLDEDAEDLVKKLWRMVIFFTESEKRGLPAYRTTTCLVERNCDLDNTATANGAVNSTVIRSPAPAVPNTLISFPSPHVLLVTLNRPDQLNAIPSSHHALFDALWSWYDAEPSLRCAVISGKGRAFCAGADLKEWNERHDSAGAAAEVAEQDSTVQTSRLSSGTTGFGGLSNRRGKKPVIAAVNGLCLGGGMEIALNCDMVLASTSARFGLPEVRVGVVALAGALPRLVRIVGRQRASEMAMLGRQYSAETMRGWGIVNAVVPRDRDVVEEAVRWAEELAGNSPDAVLVSREGLQMGWEGLGPVVATETLGRGMFGRIDGGENMREGIRSFVEKRKPLWKDSKL